MRGQARTIVPAELNLKRKIVLAGYVEVLRGANCAPLRMTIFHFLVVDRKLLKVAATKEISKKLALLRPPAASRAGLKD